MHASLQRNGRSNLQTNVYCCMLTVKNTNLKTNLCSRNFFPARLFFYAPCGFQAFTHFAFALHVPEEGCGMFR